MRRPLALTLALLALPAAAAAAPRPLAEADQARLTGQDVVVARAAGRRVTVDRVPLAAEAATRIFRYRAPRNRLALTDMDASAQRTGVVVTLANRRGEPKTAQAFLGPTAGGPLAELTEPIAADAEDVPTLFHVTGETAVLEDAEGQRQAIAPDGTATPLNLSGTISGVTFAGDLVAYGEHVGGETEEDPPTRLVVANWRTGELVRGENLPAGILALDLREDGAVVMRLDGAGIQTALPGAPVNRLTDSLSDPVWAGDRIVALRNRIQGWRELTVVEPDGSQRPFGVPSATLEQVTADAANVAWVGNGCAFVAEIGERATSAVPDGPCPTAEALVTSVSARVDGRRLPLRIRCLAAAEACAGRVTSPATEPARYSVEPGSTLRMRLRLTDDVEVPGTLALKVTVEDGRTLRPQLSLVSSGR